MIVVVIGQLTVIAIVIETCEWNPEAGATRVESLGDPEGQVIVIVKVIMIG